MTDKLSFSNAEAVIKNTDLLMASEAEKRKFNLCETFVNVIEDIMFFFGREYPKARENLYDSKPGESVVYDLCTRFSEEFEEIKFLVKGCITKRGDIFSSDAEVAALMRSIDICSYYNPRLNVFLNVEDESFEEISKKGLTLDEGGVVE